MARRAEKGSVVVRAKAGKLRIVLPRSIGNGEQQYIYTGFDDTAPNQAKAKMVCLHIEADIATDQLDRTLEKYKALLNEIKASKNVEITKKLPTLPDLWDKYVDFKSSQVANTTFRKDFVGRYQNAIKSLPYKRLNDAVKIRDYFLEQYSAATTRRMLMQLNACCKWAIRSKLINSNPFDGLSSDIKVKRWDINKIDPFTRTERDAIITAFESDTLYSPYTNFVRFLFLTGCRPGEAFGLKWRHIKRDCSEIYFCENYAHLYGTSDTTKDGENRRFPCNSQLKQLLNSLKTEQYNPNWLVFPSPIDQREIKTNTFDRIWKGIVTHLVDTGLVSRYRRPYNTRHTFISMCLEQGIPAQTVAKWVGNSPEVIYQHYAGNTCNVSVPIL